MVKPIYPPNINFVCGGIRTTHCFSLGLTMLVVIGGGLQYDTDIMYSVWTTCSLCTRSKATLPVQDNVDTLEILSKNIQGTVSHFFYLFLFYLFKLFTTKCSSCLNASMGRQSIVTCLTMQYKYPSGSWGAIETNMATIYFYWFMSALFWSIIIHEMMII